MRCVVTGAAGFVGSHLCEELLRRGHTVAGVDCFAPCYPPPLKAHNQQVLLAHPHYHFHAADLRRDPLADIVDGADVLFHLAGTPGRPRGWAEFDGHLSCHVLGTQRLLDAVRAAGHPRRFVLASSAAVYGRLALGNESAPTRPVSAYGVTKLAAEQLCHAHADAHGLPLVVLRYFGVYGPRQRPDMAVHRFARALLTDRPVEVDGDGQQVRAGTFITDCVEATLAAADAPIGETYNVGGDEPTAVLDLIARLEAVSGRRAVLAFQPPRPGDPRQAVADTTKIRRHLKWQPRTPLDDGLARQWAWQTAVDDELFGPPAGGSATVKCAESARPTVFRERPTVGLEDSTHPAKPTRPGTAS